MLLQCGDSSTSPHFEIQGNQRTFSWTLLSLPDTLVLDVRAINEDSYIAFTGLEVMYGNLQSHFELDFFRNRTGFEINDESQQVYSFEDSTWFVSSPEYTTFDTLHIPPASGNIEFWEGKLFYADTSDQFLSYDVETETLDTLLTVSKSLRVATHAGSTFFLKLDSQLQILDVSKPTMGLSDSNLPVNTVTKAIEFTNGQIIIGTRNSKAFISTNGGESWDETWPELIPGNMVTDFVSNQAGELYMSILGSGFYYSEDSGSSWGSIELPNLNLEVYAVDVSPELGILIATNFGVYRGELIE